ncbi:MAG: hypothetical protein AB8B86_11960 [Pseudomonadales bacterium]
MFQYNINSKFSSLPIQVPLMRHEAAVVNWRPSLRCVLTTTRAAESKLLSAKYALLFIAAFLAGCESTGTIPGVSDGKNVQFEYQQRFFESDGTLRITMPEGETYTGKFVQRTLSTTGDEWEIGESSNDDSFIFNNSNTTSSQAEAVLIGNKGSTMKCKLQLSDPSFGIDAGGIGSCKTSAGKPIDFAF